MGYSALKIALIFVYYAVQLSGKIGFVMSIDKVKDYFPEERDGLLQLRDFINSTSNLHGNWTGPPCYKNDSRWTGIACLNGHVTDLVLEGIQITGSLPQTPFLRNVTLLSKLSLRNNFIRGPLPNLKNLLNLEQVLLSENQFSGSIPFEYINLPRLKMLELQQNSLTGSIPPFDQPTLTTLNVSYNHLAGRIPSNQVLNRFPESSYDHNSALCGQPLGTPCKGQPPHPSPRTTDVPSNDKTKGTLAIWRFSLIAASAVLVSLSVMLAFLCYYSKVHGKDAKGDQSGTGYAGIEEKKMYRSENTDDPERMLKHDPERVLKLEFFDKKRRVFDSHELLRAKAEVMGNGKLGTTYKAVLESGNAVVVKRLKDMNALSNREFVQQMQLLGNTRHENLAEIISFHYSVEEKLVIYEFVPYGSLFELLHENRGVGRVPLNWTARLSIIKDTAKGLAYLHQSLPYHRVPHGNLKSSNVLIHRNGQNHQSKLTDFGLLPLLTSRKSIGKLAAGKSPEFSLGRQLTYKVDVYCFGMILLEVITGKNPGEISRANEGMFDDLSDWVRSVLKNDRLTDVLDVEILSARQEHDVLLILVEMALECTDMAPEKRPKMREVLRRIEELEQLNKQNGDNITCSF